VPLTMLCQAIDCRDQYHLCIRDSSVTDTGCLLGNFVRETKVMNASQSDIVQRRMTSRARQSCCVTNECVLCKKFEDAKSVAVAMYSEG
jgi:hypothetical protein